MKAGAPEEILFVAKPHIGTFRLVGMVEKMRADIEALGGEIRFEQRVTDVLVEAGHIRGVTLASVRPRTCRVAGPPPRDGPSSMCRSVTRCSKRISPPSASMSARIFSIMLTRRKVPMCGLLT